MKSAYRRTKKISPENFLPPSFDNNANYFKEVWFEIIYFDSKNLDYSLWGFLKRQVEIKASTVIFERLNENFSEWKERPIDERELQCCFELIALAQKIVQEPFFQIQDDKNCTDTTISYAQKIEIAHWLHSDDRVRPIKGAAQQVAVVAAINKSGGVADLKVEAIDNGHGICYADPFSNGLIQFNEDFNKIVQRVYALAKQQIAKKNTLYGLEHINLRYRLAWRPPAQMNSYRTIEAYSIESAFFICLYSTLESYLKYLSLQYKLVTFLRDDHHTSFNSDVAVTATINKKECLRLGGVDGLRAKFYSACKEKLYGIVIAKDIESEACITLDEVKKSFIKCETRLMPAECIEEAIVHLSSVRSDHSFFRYIHPAFRTPLILILISFASPVIGYALDFNLLFQKTTFLASLFLFLLWMIIHQLYNYGIFNSTFFVSYIAGFLSTIVGAFLYAFGPLAINDRIEAINQIMEAKPIWHIKLIRFMIPGLILPIFFGILFAIRSAKARIDAKTGIAWLLLTLILGSFIRLCVDLFKYRIKYPNFWYIFTEEKVGNVRFETFLIVALLSITTLIIFENWKKGYYEIKLHVISRLIFPLLFVFLTGSLVASFHFGKGLSLPAGSFFNAISYTGLISGWAIGCFYLFTGDHYLIQRLETIISKFCKSRRKQNSK